MEEADRIKRKILREYDRDPTGWHVFAARDSRGYFDTVVVHGREVWLIKEHAVNPFESVGFGIRSLADDLRLEGPPYTFGFRPVDRESMEEVLRRASEGQSLLDTLRTILERSPQPLREIRTPLPWEARCSWGVNRGWTYSRSSGSWTAGSGPSWIGF